MEKIIKILATTKDGTVTGYSVFSDAGEIGNKLIIKHASGVKYEFKDIGIKHAPDQMLVKRNGKNLEINFDVDGHKGEDVTPDLIIENYYEFGSSDIVGMAEDGKYYSYIPQEYQGALEIGKLSEGSFSYQSLGEVDSGFPVWILGLGLAGLGGGGGGGGEENQAPAATNNTNMIYEDGLFIIGNIITDNNGFGVDSDADGGTLTVTNITGGNAHGTLTFNPDGSYSYAVDNTDPAVQALADGETATEVYTYTVSDGNGGTDTATLTITITGTNDNLVLTVEATGATTEDDATPNLTDSGTLSFTDVDTTDTHTVTPAYNDDAIWSGGTLTPAQITALTSGFTADTNSWDYTVLNSETQFLADGETVIFSYDITVDDGNGGTDTQTATVTINGINDNPVLTVETTGATTEDDATPNLTDSGTLSFTDVDTTDTHTVTPAYNDDAIWSGGTLTPAQITALTSGFTADTNSWDYTVLNSETQFLADGETVIFSYDITVDDGNGGTDTQTATLTVTGTNDAPVVSLTDVVGTGTEMVTPIGDITDSGTITFTDVDVTDAHTVSVTSTSPTPLGVITPTILTDTTGSGIGGVVGWVYNAPAASLEYLAEGETKSATFVITLDDGNGSTIDRTVTITVTGTNDIPMVSATDVTGAVTEMGTPLGNITDSGSLTFADVDLLDIHSVSVTATSPTPLGTLVPTINTDTIGSGVGGVIDWTYSVVATDVEYLAVGETKIETFTVTLDDNEGGTVDRDVTVTITGTNDAPILSVEATGAVTEDNATPNLTDTGTLSFTDVDLSDTHTITSIYNDDVVWSGGTLTPAQITAITSGFTADNNSWDYSVANSETQFLAVGEIVTFSYDITVDDGNGGTDTQTVTITVTGTNDVPIATANTNSIGNENTGSVDGDLIYDDDGFGEDSDADLSDTLTVTGMAGGDVYGTLTWHADGSYEYDVDNTDPAVSGLTGTDTLTEVYTYTVNDGHGGTDTDTLTITITDDNDAPDAINDVNSIIEDTVNISGNVTPGTLGQDSDTDAFMVTGTEVGIHSSTNGNINTNIVGLYGTLVIQSDGSYVYALDNTNPLVQGLSVGETLTETFSYTITDTFGAHDTAQLDITINGANDTVTITVNDINGATAGDIAVEEKALLDGTEPTLTTEMATGTFIVTAPDGLDHITVDGTNVTLAQLEGATLGVPVNVIVTNGTMSITDYDSSTGVVSYIYTLTSPDTTTPSADDGVTTLIESIVITAVDDDGSNGNDDMDIGIVDDVPAPPVYNLDLEPAPINTNLLITFDISGSMNDSSGVAGLTRLELAKIAVMDMVYQYEVLGDVMIQVVLFSDTATYAPQWMTVSQAEAYLYIVSAGNSTNYDAALAGATTAFSTSGKLTTDAQNIAYFFSDGEPTSPTGSIGINSTEETTWETFLINNDIKSYAVGLGTGVSATALEPIAYDGIVNSEIPALVVDDLSVLSSTLSATVPPPTQYLNLSGGVDNNFFGADGGYISSVELDGGTYEYDGTGTMTVSGDTTGYSFNGTTHVLTQTTDNGGVLTLDMDDGAFSYTQPSYTPVGYTGSLVYEMTDGDGDTESNIAYITVDPTPTIPPLSYTGTSGVNIYVGKGGDDIINGAGGNDVLSGAAGDDTIDGGSGDDNILGGAGDDILTGGIGLDYLFGDIGDDILNIDTTDLGTQTLDGVIDGGDGFDTVTLASGQNLDLNDFDSGLAVNIEAIDLTANGNHNITNITYQDVIAITDSDNDLYVLGDSADNVTFAILNGWNSGAASSVDVNGTMHTMIAWTNSNNASVTVYVESVI